MAEDKLPTEIEVVPPSQPDVFEQLARAERDFFSFLEQINLDSAYDIATLVVQGLDNLPYDAFGPDDTARLHRELDIYRFLQAVLAGLRKSRSRDFQGAADAFETATRLTDGIRSGIDAADPRRSFLEYWHNLAETHVPLMRAAESLLRGNPAEAARQLNRAEVLVESFLDDTPNSFAAILTAQPDDEEASVSAQRILDIYGSYLTQAANMYAAVVAFNVDLDGAARFFDRHLDRVRSLHERQPTVGPLPPQYFKSLLDYAQASKFVVDVHIALRDKNYDGALASCGQARALFREVSRSIPKGLPLSETLREICFNQATVTLPQLEEQVRREKALVERIKMLEMADADRARELRETMLRRDEIIRELARPIALSVSAQSTAQLEAQISTSLSLSIEIQNKGLDEVLRLLDEIRGKLPEGDTEAIRNAAKDAKEERDLSKKIEKVANVIEAFGKVADAASDFLPYGRIAYRILRSLFS